MIIVKKIVKVKSADKLGEGVKHQVNKAMQGNQNQNLSKKKRKV